MTNNQNPRDSLNLESHFRWLRVRRRTASEWLAWGLWLLSLAILLEYTWSSFVEGETQATVLAGALFFGLLAAGVIVNIMRGVDAQSIHKYPSQQIAQKDDALGSSFEPDETQANGRPLTRRQFIKTVGMAGVTAGAAGSTALVAGSQMLGTPMSGGVYRRPWWVRQVEVPTTGIDWDMMQRVDAARNTLAGNPALGRFGSAEENDYLETVRRENELSRLTNNETGFTLKDVALANAFSGTRDVMPRTFLGPRQAPRPEDLGVDRWQGSPDENARLLKVAMQQMGAATVGIVELDERTRKLIYSVDNDGKRLEFENVEHAYEDTEKRVIPFAARWVVVYAVQMSDIAIRRAPTKIAQMATTEAYQRGLMIQNNVQEFLRGLGYQGLGEAELNGLGIAPALAVLAGLGELSRLNRVVTPEFGPMVRIFKLITDLPLAPDKPIDAGIARFCRTCKKCAEACPPSALSFDTEPGWIPIGEWSNPGHQAWFEDSVRCRRYWYEEAGSNCGICFSVCPFSKRNRSFMHDLVRMQIATFPELDELTRTMDDAFGYGVQKDPGDWWDLDLPEYGIDTHKD
jgi:reductive dehalogenase